MARRVGLLTFTVFCSMWFCLPCVAGAQELKLPPPPDFEQLLQKMAGEPPEACGEAEGWDAEKRGLEEAAFARAAERVTEALNAAPDDGRKSKERANAVLKKLEERSAEVNRAWPVDHRFHSEVFDLDPLLIVTMSIRSQQNYFAFGILAPANSGKLNQQWQELGQGYLGEEVPYISLKIYPLHRGPSGNPRFLASFVRSGCAGSIGVRYDIEEWGRKSQEYLSPRLKQDGAFGMDSEPSVPGPTKKTPFPTIGKLQTVGTRLTLPYCWFTDIDTWDNPSLCALDTYDLSGDAIGFVKRQWNRPDLLPVAKVLEYAKKHDYPEVRAYCGSAAVARKLMRELDDGYGFDAELETVRLGAASERVRAAYSGDPGFVVEKRGNRWVVVAFDEK